MITQLFKEALIRVLEGTTRCAGTLVFPSPVTGRPFNNIKKALQSAAERAGITKKVYPHLLCHSYATRPGKRRGFKDLAGPPGTPGHSDNADLYPCDDTAP